MKGYWITFTDKTAGYCNGESDYDAKVIAAKIAGKPVATAEPLPYPATPIIWQYDHPAHGKCPAFCYTPAECKGRQSREKSLTEREHERLKRTLKYAVAACLEEVGTPDTLTTIAEEFHSWAQEFGKFSQQERFQLAGMIHKLAEDAEQASL